MDDKKDGPKGGPKDGRDLRAQLKDAILTLTAERGPGKSISPAEAARAVRPEDWNRLMGMTRHAAIELVREGRIEILRKGKPVDPDEVRGVVRLRLVQEGAASAPVEEE
ncbi:MAG: DUF3253 domain-containing protein [Alphaproteobacteria bacterium]|nr:DUF3253 domain-containing protein [Alphaproteobacteria bacterium]MBU0795933.1 DUF3253 domain-containing protein [Alphaproteobacteria bacterium]MBU0886970.1 DUF3253 domain-containing protein [Alphaproteobacteria bacterium]MBU1813174.1 DUF3253 domain-containing protein [Alphaproteobacteria bacterium]MBU2092081.1 DUF3253 domain-containing protein [Alphaproteobacteria bacterium]